MKYLFDFIRVSLIQKILELNGVYKMILMLLVVMSKKIHVYAEHIDKMRKYNM